MYVDPRFIPLLITGFGAVVAGIVVLAVVIVNDRWRKEAVSLGKAEYFPVMGGFGWRWK